MIVDGGSVGGFPLVFHGNTWLRPAFIDIDGLGRIHVAGHYGENRIDIGGHGLSGSPESTGFVATVSPGGEVLATQSLRSSARDEIRALVSDDAGNLYVAGYSYADSATVFGTPTRGFSFVARLNVDESASEYQVVWLDTPDDVIEDIALMGSEVAVVTHNAWGTHVRKYATDGGAVLSSWSFGDDASRPTVHGRRVAVDSIGRLVIGGSYQGNSIDFGEGPVTAFPSGSFLVCFAPDRSVVFSVITNGDSLDRIDSLLLDPDDRVFVAATMHGDVDWGGGVLPQEYSPWDTVLASFSTTGAHRWSRRFGASTFMQFFMSSGHLYFLAGGPGTPLVDDGVELRRPFMLQLDLDGASEGTYDDPVGSRPEPWLGAFGDNGDLILTGTFDDTIELGSVRIEPVSDGPTDVTGDIFLHRQASPF
jgi:hypothetical protein